MPKIKICFSAVFGNKYLTMLIGTHRTGIDIQIGINLENCYTQAACFEEAPQARGGNPFPQR